MPSLRKPANPFRYFNSSTEIIRLAVMLYGSPSASAVNILALLIGKGRTLPPEEKW